MTDAMLRKFVTGFRAGLLGNLSSQWMCFAVCAPLQGYLATMGCETELMQGEIIDADGDTMSHMWLALPDGRIVDPTADQFKTPTGEPMPPVYIGEAPTWYRAQERVRAMAL